MPRKHIAAYPDLTGALLLGESRVLRYPGGHSILTGCLREIRLAQRTRL